MKAVGFIVEYNPFHNGHAWHLAKAKELSGCTFSVGIMSGNFMQRGEPALFDKWIRAEMAVQSGVDLIIELPFVFSVRSAQHFAANGIRLLAALGVISHVCFGTECADSSLLSTIAKASELDTVKLILKENLQKGLTYAAALSYAIAETLHIPKDLLTAPNTILSVEYLRAITKFAPDLLPLPIKRRDNNYHDTKITGPLASATAVREALYTKSSLTSDTLNAIPETSAQIIQEASAIGRGPSKKDSLDTFILGVLRTMSLAKLKNLTEISEGLEHKIKDCAVQAASLTEFYDLLKSRRYPKTRLQRIITHAMLNTTKEQIIKFDELGPLYARVLAFNQNGRLLLKEIKSHASIPVITKTTHFLNSYELNNPGPNPLKNMLALDVLATDIYALTLPGSKWKLGGLDFRQSPIYIP